MATLRVAIDARLAQQGAALASRAFATVQAGATKLSTGLAATGKGFAGLVKNATGAGGAFSRLGAGMQAAWGAARGLVGVMGPLTALFTAAGIIQQINQYQSLQNRLRLVTDSSAELGAVQRELFNVAQNTRSSFSSTVDLYSRLHRASEELGLSQRDLIGITEAVNQAITIGGNSATEAEAALIQLGQGLSSGTLRGDELRSVLEQTPRLARAIAEGMGVTIGQLRTLGMEGKLTSEAVVKAIQSQAGVLQQEFGKTLPTLGQGFQVLKNSTLAFVGEFDKAVGLSSALGGAMSSLSKAIDANAESWFAAAFEASQFLRIMGHIAGKILSPEEMMRSGNQTRVNVINRFAEWFDSDGLREMGAKQQAEIDRIFGKEEDSLADQLDARRTQFQQDKEIRQAIADLDKNPDKGGGGPSAASLEAAKKRREELKKFAEQTAEAVRTPAEELDAKVKQLDAALRAGLLAPELYSRAILQAAEAYNKADPAAEAYLEQIEEAKKLNEEARAPFEVMAQSVEQYQNLLAAGILTQEGYALAVQKVTDAFLAADPAAQKQKEMMEEGAQLTESLRTPFEVLADEAQRYQDLLGAGAINEETYSRAVLAASNSYLEAINKKKDANLFLEEIVKQAARNIQDAFAEFLFNPFEAGLDGLLQSFIQTLHQMAAQALSAEVFRILGEQLTKLGGGAGSGSFFGTLISGAASVFGGGKASGGPTEAGKTYMVGEKGPELVSFKRSAHVTPNHKLSQGAAPVFNPNINVPPAQVVIVDDPSKIPTAMKGAAGQQATIENISRNKTAIKQILAGA